MLGTAPYFDQSFYVGFRVGGYELGLNPGADSADGPVTYWGIRVASVRSPDRFILGIIENPHLTAE